MLILLVSLLLVRYFRAEFIIDLINSINIDEIFSDMFLIISSFISLFINEPIYDYYILSPKIEKENKLKSIYDNFVLKMRRVGNEAGKRIRSNSSPSISSYSTSSIKSTLTPAQKKQTLIIPSHIASAAFEVTRFIQHKGQYVYRNMLHKFIKTDSGFEPFDKNDLTPCKNFLNKETPAEKMEFLHKNHYEILQCSPSGRKNE